MVLSGEQSFFPSLNLVVTPCNKLTRQSLTVLKVEESRKFSALFVEE